MLNLIGTTATTTLVSADTFTPVIEQLGAIIPLALAAGMGIFALIRGAKLVPKAIGWFAK